MIESEGLLYVVATPIGNLGDISERARDTLASVALIAAEDTRHTGALLRRLGIATPMVSLHEHNESRRVAGLLERLRDGASIALVSDAGTPLVSDPGFRLLSAVRDAGIRAVPIPGPCAAIAALSVAGLPCDRFVFEGFLPSRAAARRERIGELAAEKRTLVFYESARRIGAALADLSAGLGAQRPASLQRELTKAFETVSNGTLGELAASVAGQTARMRGEITLIVAGCAAKAQVAALDQRAVLRMLLAELPPRRAAVLAARLTGGSANTLYREALSLAPD